MNEKILPVLKYWGYIKEDVIFKYNNKIDMSTEDKIKIFDVLTDKYEVDPEVINMEWGIQVGSQRNLDYGLATNASTEEGEDDKQGEGKQYVMSDEEYEKRYGHPKEANGKVNFL